MSAAAEQGFRTYVGAERIPPEAAELFGQDAERDYGDRTVPVAIAAATDDEENWRGGVFMLVERDSGTASIRQVVVRPEFRGRGLAGFLLRRAHTVAAEHGCTRIRSTAGWGCPDHLAMYGRLGYEQTRGDGPYLVQKAL